MTLEIIVDTNVFLECLNSVSCVLDASLNSTVYGELKVILPWVVMQELDVLKHGYVSEERQESKAKAALAARQAVTFIYNELRRSKPRIVGQRMTEFHSEALREQSTKLLKVIFEIYFQIQIEFCH